MKKTQLTKTFRIDLIPGPPAGSATGKKRRMVITAKTKRQPGAETAAQLVRATGYHGFLQSIYDAAIIADRGGRITDVNERAVEFFQYSPAQFCQLTMLDVINGADALLLKRLSENLESHRFSLIQAYCERRDSSLFPAEISVNRLDVGEIRLCFLVRDITVRRQSEEMLRTEHNAISNSGSGIAVADVATNLEYVNPAAAAMWGYEDADELLGVGVAALFADAEAGRRMIETAMSGEKNGTAVMKGRRRDGTEFDVQVSAVRNWNAEGELVGAVLSLVDVSDRLRAEAAEREAERQRVMLESLGAVTHHMGQPATVLLANLEMLALRQTNLSDDDKRLLEASIEAAESLSRILHRLNKVHAYKTMKYLEETESRILEI